LKAVFTFQQEQLFKIYSVPKLLHYLTFCVSALVKWYPQRWIYINL